MTAAGGGGRRGGQRRLALDQEHAHAVGRRRRGARAAPAAARAGGAVHALRGDDRLGIEAEPGEPAMRVLDVVHREGQAREPFTLGVEDRAQALRAGAVARGRDQLRRHVGELEDRGLGPAARRLRPPARGAVEEALVGGDPHLEIADRDDHVVERVNHATASWRRAGVAGTVREV